MFVFLENVAEANKLSFEINGYFKELGYEFRDTVIDVYSVGGFHERKRWFALAYLESIGMEGLRAEGEQESQSLDISLLPLCTGDGQWKIEPDIRRVPDGVPNKSHRLKALGNSVVPLQAREAWKKLTGINGGRCR